MTTYAGYEYLIRVHAVPALGEVPLSELSPLHFQRLYSSLLDPERHLSAGTVLNLHLVLTQALGQAVRWGIVEQNPVKGAQPPRPSVIWKKRTPAERSSSRSEALIESTRSGRRV